MRYSANVSQLCWICYISLMWNLLRILCTKNNSNQLVFDWVIHKIKGERFYWDTVYTDLQRHKVFGVSVWLCVRACPNERGILRPSCRWPLQWFLYFVLHRRRLPRGNGGDCPKGKALYTAPPCDELDPSKDIKLVFVQKIAFVLRKINKNCCHAAALFDSNMYCNSALGAGECPRAATTTGDDEQSQ